MAEFQQFGFGQDDLKRHPGDVPRVYFVGPAASPDSDEMEGLRQLTLGQVDMFMHITDGSGGDVAYRNGDEIRIPEHSWHWFEADLKDIPHQHERPPYGQRCFKVGDLKQALDW